MFTGIIEELGTVKSLVKGGAISELQVLAPGIASAIQPGQSISVNGTCLTVVEIRKDLLRFELMPESIMRTNLGQLKQQDLVNLERALSANGRLDGHFVSGHIDGTGIISKRQTKVGDIIITVKCSPALLRYMVLKGSLALDGVSLTVSALEEDSFGVNLIPYTLKNTTLGFKKEGNIVNIECDLLAKYIDKLLLQNKRPFTPLLTPSFLREYGFI